MTSHTESRPQHATKRGLALLVIAAAQLLIVMDGTIVTVGLPTIGAGLTIAESDLDWVLTSYALAFGGLLLAGAAPATCSADAGCSASGWWCSCSPPCWVAWRRTAAC